MFLSEIRILPTLEEIGLNDTENGLEIGEIKSFLTSVPFWQH